jgi:hypothetical protein
VAPPQAIEFGAWLKSLAPSNPVAAAASNAVLPLVIFALFFAFAVTQLPAAQRAFLVQLFESVAGAMIIIVKWVLLAAPLGVFALARSEETNPSTFMSLAIDQAGLLRGTYYDAVSDSTQNISGKVDKKTQRAAWTIGDKKLPVYEAGLANLTQQQTTILVHRDDGKGGPGKVEQMLLVRVQDDAAGGADAAAKPTAAKPAAPKPAAATDLDGSDDL